MNYLILGAEPGAENHWWLPHDLNEIWWATSALAVVLFVIVKFGGPAIKDMWNGRIDRIAGEIDDAATSRQEAESSLVDVRARIADMDAERSRILDEARETAEAVKAQIIERAREDAADLVRRGEADVEAAKAQAFAEVEHDVAELALGAAEAVVVASLDQATHQELIESYISGVSGSGAVSS